MKTMKLKKYFYGVALGALSLTYASCYNADKDFPDYDGGTKAYFAYQYPVRTLVLGNDIYDNSLDNAHKCRIWATMGGAYKGRNATVSFVVDPTLCENLHFQDDGGYPAGFVTPMPADYYTLSSNVIPYNGNTRGYVEVQFTDKFFEDENAINNYYVIPLRMTSASGMDGILSGTPNVESPVRQNAQDWTVLPMDYVLYCVKYMNPWQGKYIRRGVDVVTEAGKEPATIIRKDFSLYNSDIEHYSKMDPSNPVNQYDEVCGITTVDMTKAKFPVSFKTSTGASISCNLILAFDGNNCTISTDDAGVTATGNGEFITKGTERKEYKDYQWGSNNGKPVQRDILRLAYNVNFTDKNIQVSTNDTLVVQTRESNKKEFFDYKYVKE